MGRVGVEADTRLEPGASTVPISTAMSLKRIGDLLEKLVRKAMEEEINRG